jgi:hypothetical protein
MATILQFPRPRAAFDASATGAVVSAYEKASAVLEQTHHYSPTVREIVARRIIAAAAKGETDPEQLCRSALAALARMRPQRDSA